METTAEKTEGTASIPVTDFVYEVSRGVGMIGGYLHNILADTMYYAGRYAAYVRSVCSGCPGFLCEANSDEGKITMMSLVRSGVVIDEADKREFYMNFGRDMAEVTKSGLESENLTIIDLSKYKL